jgi:hypothetical protein
VGGDAGAGAGSRTEGLFRLADRRQLSRRQLQLVGRRRAPDPTSVITDVHADVQALAIGAGHTFGVFGKLGRASVTIPVSGPM